MVLPRPRELGREMKEARLTQSSLDPCLFYLRSNDQLKGICGVHVDDLLGGGTPEMDEVLTRLRSKLPFGDFRTLTIRYTGIEVRQDPQTTALKLAKKAT